MLGFNPLYRAVLGLMGGPQPALSLDFLAGGLNPAVVTFSRASNATQFDSLGRLVWAPHNLHSRSGVETAVVGSPGSAPSGWGLALGTSNGVTKSIVAKGFDQGVEYIDVRIAGTFVALENFSAVPPPGITGTPSLPSEQWCASLYWGVVAGVLPPPASAGVSGCRIRFGSPGLLQQIGDSDVPRYVFGRVSNTRTAPASTTVVGSDFLWAFGAGVTVDVTIRLGAFQLERAGADSPKVYVKTTGTVYYGPRFDYDPATLAARGLLIEEARTNLVINASLTPAAGSPATAVRNAVGITGLANDAWTITDSATLNYQMAGSDGFTATAAQHTISCFVKAGTANRCQLALSAAASSEFANFSLAGAGSVLLQNASTTATIQQYGNGWYRIAITVTLAVAGTQIFIVHINSDTAGRLVAYSGTGLTLIACYTQAEVGAFATSLIPTFGAAATRAGDVADLSSAPAYDPAGVTYYASWERYAIPLTGVSTAFFFVGDGSTFLSIESGSSNPAQQRSNLTNATAQQGLLGATDGVPNTVYKFAARWAPNDGIAVQNGTLTAPDNLVTMPASLPSSRLWIGRGATGSALQMHGWMREIRVYAEGLSNAQLQALTS